MSALHFLVQFSLFQSLAEWKMQNSKRTTLSNCKEKRHTFAFLYALSFVKQAKCILYRIVYCYSIHIFLLFHLHNITSIYLFTFRKSYSTDKENLFDNQDFLKLVIICLILLTFTFHSRLMLQENLEASHSQGLKG